ncbi:DnaB-like helicase C-terminal domain-containing protein [Methylobacterium sp. ID0610]|uniref:DnaB-like helicase C-terminal domain-containing protein n=1 Tax=Methylobacterium carpenticola TaxID=3344827 RepID=UPI0036C56D15
METEQALLGALLQNNDALAVVSPIVGAEHFFEPVHASIFRALAGLAEQGIPATVATLKPYLGDADLGGLTVSQYLARLHAEAITVIGAAGYAQSIRKLAIRRDLVQAGKRLMDRARFDGPEVTPDAMIEEAELDLLDARASAPKAHLAGMTAGEGAAWMIERIRGMRAGEIQVPTIPTGLQELDRATAGGFGRGQLWLLAGRPGMGKAQPLDAKVHTPAGWRAMGDLNVGDAVSSVDGAPSQVIGVFDQGTKPVYRIAFSDGRETRCCAEHLWEVRYRDWPAARVLETSKLIEMLGRARYRGRLMVRLHSGEIGTSTDLPLDPWLLGVIIGDGGLSTGRVRISLPDAEIRTRVASALPKGHVLSPQGGIDYLVTSGGRRNGVRAILADLGLLGSRAESKFLPRAYLDASREQRLALLQGLLDTAGWVERQGSARFSTASPRLARDIVELARSLGFWATSSTKEAHLGSMAEGRVRKQDAHQVCITGRAIATAFTLPRKAERLKDRSWFRVLTIESISPDGEAPCRCIAVSHPTRLYITDDHVVTHNTVTLTSLSRYAARDNGVLVFQLEVTRDQMMARYLADLCYAAHRPLTFGSIMHAVDLDDEDLWRLEDAQKRLSRLQLRIECEPGVSIAQIQAGVKAEKKRLERIGQRLGVVFIDYLKFIRVSERYKGNKVLEVGEISGALKTLAKAEDICVVLLTQLNRGVEAEGRADRRPSLADLRDSGELEQDADVVLFLYREGYYLEKKVKANPNDADLSARLIEKRNALEMILGKNRAGPTPTLDLWVDVASSTIASHARGPA